MGSSCGGTIEEFVLFGLGRQLLDTDIKGVVNCQNSRDKGPPEGNSARG